jgi:cell division protein FtsQ
VIKIFFGIILIPFAMGGAFFFLNQQGIFNIDNIEIVIQNGSEQTEYLRPFIKNLDEKLENQRGVSIWKIDLQKLNQELSSLSWIKEISFSRRWPSKLRVSIEAKEIRLLLITKSGSYSPIESNGVRLPNVDLKQLPDVAVLQGDVFEKNIDLRKKAVEILNEIPKDGTFSQKTISEIHYDEKDGFWMTLIKDGIKVKMGHDQVSSKSIRVGQVLEYAESRKMDVRVIDANLSKKVLVKLRKNP